MMIVFTETVYAASEIDYDELLKSSTISIDETGKWTFDKLIMVFDKENTSTSYAAVFNFSGKKGEKIIIPPMMYFLRSPSPDNEELKSVVLGISTLKAYKISSAKGKELSMFPLLPSMEEMVLDLSECDEIAVILNYTHSKYTFKLSKEEYAPIKEFCNVLLTSKALYAISDFALLGLDNIVKVEHTIFVP